jgi:hypothetical protein
VNRAGVAAGVAAGRVRRVDALVEFCRTGALGPLRKGLSAAEVERLLGTPDSVRWVQGDDHWQRYRYGSLSIMTTCGSGEQPDKEHLRVRTIGVSFNPMPLALPAPVAGGLTHDWSSARADDVLGVLRGAGVEVTLESETSNEGRVHQHLRAGDHRVSISVFEGAVTRVEGG